MIYLDYNATTPLRPQVKTAMLEAFDVFGNPSSVHRYGRQARSIIDAAREIVADALQVKPAQVIFTSGGTEANNTILQDYTKQGGACFVSLIEHDSLRKVVSDTIPINVTNTGQVDIDHLNDQLRNACRNPHGPELISVMLANNETGIIQPIQEVVEAAANIEASVHCDVIPAFGKLPVNFSDLGVDYFSLSAHKIGGPKGVGALVTRLESPIAPLLRGGGQERGARAGTESVIQIAGFGAAVAAMQNDDWQQVRTLRDHLENSILAEYPEIPIYGREVLRLPGTSLIGMPGVSSQQQLMSFDLANIAVSAGSACSSGKVTSSHVLKAMGVDEQSAGEAIRVSLGWESTPQDIETFLQVWKRIYRKQIKEVA